jgi:hypothetical protein
MFQWCCRKNVAVKTSLDLRKTIGEHIVGRANAGESEVGQELREYRAQVHVPSIRQCRHGLTAAMSHGRQGTTLLHAWRARGEERVMEARAFALNDGLNLKIRHKLIQPPGDLVNVLCGPLYLINLPDHGGSSLHCIAVTGETGFGKSFLLKWISAHVDDAHSFEMKLGDLGDRWEQSVPLLDEIFLQLQEYAAEHPVVLQLDESEVELKRRTKLTAQLKIVLTRMSTMKLKHPICFAIATNRPEDILPDLLGRFVRPDRCSFFSFSGLKRT